LKNPQEDDEEQDDLPVIDIDADPQNANWLRILAKSREDEAAKKQRQPQPPQQ